MGDTPRGLVGNRVAQRRRITRVIVVVAMIWAGMVSGAAAQETESVDVSPMVFPVAGDARYSDSFGAPRSEGRTHQGTDIFAAKGTPVVAVGPGTVVRITVGERAGRYIVVEHPDGWRSYYLHLNNDTPETDDGLGGAPAPGIVVGARVEAGQVLDYVGDSGNAEETPPHLHFELHVPAGDATNPYPHLRAAETGETVFTGTAAQIALRGPEAQNMLVVGSYDPGGGFTAGIAVHNDVAYLGTYGRPEACPATGVRIIDVSDPTDPSEIGAIATGAEFAGTNTDSVWVGAVDSPHFTGDLAVVGIRRCDNTERGRLESGFRGVALYDVTDTANPELMGKLAAGGLTQGVHELDVAVRPDGSVLIAATVMQSLLHTDGRRGDVRIINATNPRNPVELADWDLRRDGPTELVAEMTAARDEEELHAHGVSFAADGHWLWVAHWDAGVALVDLTRPAQPHLVTVTGFDAATEGNAHATAFDDDRSMLIRTNEDLFVTDTERHVAGWGGQQLYSVDGAGTLTEIAGFDGTDPLSEDDAAADTKDRRDGYYSAHDAVIVEGIEYVAWYSSGVRLVDIGIPTEPIEIGYFIPTPSTDPTGYWTAPDGSKSFAMVWGVAVVNGLVFISDMNTGLWIVEFDDGLDETMVDPGPANWAPIR